MSADAPGAPSCAPSRSSRSRSRWQLRAPATRWPPAAPANRPLRRSRSPASGSTASTAVSATPCASARAVGFGSNGGLGKDGGPSFNLLRVPFSLSMSLMTQASNGHERVIHKLKWAEIRDVARFIDTATKNTSRPRAADRRLAASARAGRQATSGGACSTSSRRSGADRRRQFQPDHPRENGRHPRRAPWPDVASREGGGADRQQHERGTRRLSPTPERDDDRRTSRPATAGSQPDRADAPTRCG